MDNFHNFNTPMINIDELHDKEREKTSRKFEVYRKILEKCHNKIRTTSQNASNNGYCFYQVPKYTFGVPLYDTKSCIMFLVSALTKNGFDVRYTHPNLLFISWLNKTSRSTLMIEDSQQNSYSERPQHTSSFSNNNDTNTSKNDVVSNVLDNFKPENKILFNTKKINTVDEKLAKLLGN
jgi:hypothetical protein